MNHDEELDFGEDELVPQVQQAVDASHDLRTAHSTSLASDRVGGAGGSSNGSLNGSAAGGSGGAAAGDAGAAGSSASKQFASTASATASAASTPPVSASTPNKPHDETLDEKGNKLPKGWVSRVSKSTGRLYYRNTLLNTSEWDIPTRPASASKEATPPAPPAAAPPSAAAPQPVAVESTSAPSQTETRADPPAPPIREESQDMRPAQQEEGRKPRGYIHPDRLRLTSAEPIPAVSPPTMPPTRPAADRNRPGAAQYPPRRSSQSANDPDHAAPTAASPPNGPRANASDSRQPLPPPTMPPTAPARRRGGRGKAAVTAANLVPVAPRGPRAAAAPAAPESPATPTSAAGTPTTEAPARSLSADDRWAAPKAAEFAAPNGPRFAVRGAATRGDKDLPPHLANVPSGPRFAGSAAVPPADDRWAKPSSLRNSRPASPPPRAEPSDNGRERQDSLGATSNTSGSGLTQAEKLEQQRLARLAVVGGSAAPSQPARRGHSPKRERVEPAIAPSSDDRFAAPPTGPGRGRRPPPVAAKGANAMPVGGGGWGDRARLAKEKMDGEAEEKRKREAEQKVKEEEERKRSDERAKQREEAERREREAARAEEDARREQERRAAAYGSRAARRSRSPPPRRNASPPPSSRRHRSPPPFDRRPLSPPHFDRRPLSPPPFDRRPLSPPPYARRGRSRSPPPPSRRPLSPPPFTRRGRSPTPPPYGRRPYSPPPHMRRPPSPGPPPIHYRLRSRSPPPPFPRGGRSSSPPMLRAGDRYDSSGARLPSRAFGPGVLDKSSSALRGKFRDPEQQAVNDTPLIRTAGPPMPIDDGPRGGRERPRGGRGRGGGAVERERPHDEGWSKRPGRELSPVRQDESKGGRKVEESRTNGGPAPKADLPSNPPSLLSRLGSLPEKPSNNAGSGSLAKRLRDPDEVIKEDQEKRKRVAAD
ncbi:Peptidyl-prolyl cis-trans isomerase NIMA-interacting protein 1 [Rhodotorula toruloides]